MRSNWSVRCRDAAVALQWRGSGVAVDRAVGRCCHWRWPRTTYTTRPRTKRRISHRGGSHRLHGRLHGGYMVVTRTMRRISQKEGESSSATDRGIMSL